MKEKYHTKRYQQSDLLDKDYIKRIDLISRITKQLPCLPITSFEYYGDKLFYKQKFIEQKVLPNDIDSLISVLEELGEYLEELNSNGFVHGDINSKNLIYNGEKLVVCDLEPSLWQIRNSKRQLMYTPPFISREDFDNNALTYKTDKIGFYHYVEEVLNSERGTIDHLLSLGWQNSYRHGFIEEWTNRLPIPESNLTNMNYREILMLILEKRE